MTSTAVLILYMVITAGISAFNAWSAGKVWPERRQAPFSSKLAIWSTATMSDIGFTWVYLLVFVLILSGLHGNHWLEHHKDWAFLAQLPPTFIPAVVSLGYLMVILPLLASGTIIMANMWGAAYRRRTFGSGALATYDTFANVYNYYQAVQAVPQAIRSVINFFSGLGSSSGSSSSSDDDKEEEGLLLIVIVVAALVLGFMTTAWIIKRSAKSHVGEMESRYGTNLRTRRIAAQAAGDVTGFQPDDYPGSRRFGDSW